MGIELKYLRIFTLRTIVRFTQIDSRGELNSCDLHSNYFAFESFITHFIINKYE